MHYIIDGQDLTGKSTLVNSLREILTSPIVIHSQSPPKTVTYLYQYELRYYKNLANLASKNVDKLEFIFDRFHFGTHVYGVKYRNYEPRAVKNLFEQVEESAFGADVALILLTDYGSSIKSRDDGKSFEKSEEEYDDTRKRFLEAFEMSTLKKLHINITDNGGFENTLPAVKKFLGK